MIYSFENFELDTRQYELRCGDESRQVEPQVFDVLNYLIQHRDRVVSKEELYQNVWGDRIVTESALTSRLKAARKALGDSGSEQRLIKTLHGRGYRFVGDVEERAVTASQPIVAGSTVSPTPMSTSVPEMAAVGRNLELQQLLQRLAAAREGSRQLVFVTGEAGLGKTTLVDEFVKRIENENSTRVLSGQCLEHHGQGEAYLPVLEAMGRICRQEGGSEVTELLRRRAPSWLIEMPGLIDTDALAILRQDARGMTRNRMLREMVEALEELTQDEPGVLVLEDLHWSDPSTVDLLTYLANRQEPARLLVVGTYRPTDARSDQHPVAKVVDRLKIRSQATEISLSLLSEESIRAYLEKRLPGATLPHELPKLLSQRTDGNPLFMGSVVDHWISQSMLDNSGGPWKLVVDLDELSVGVPESLRLLIERRLSDLPEVDLKMVEAASVVGVEFPAAAVAAAVDVLEDEVEEHLSALARSGTLLCDCAMARWPDGTVSACYRFVHDVFQEVLYERIPAGRRARLHAKIGDRLETGYGAEARDRAAELASHFVEGHDNLKAVEYLRLAAQQALRRLAHLEGIEHLTRGLGLLTHFPEDRVREEFELSLQAALAPALISNEGLGSKGAEAAFIRARELAERLDDRTQLLAMIYGLAILNELRGNFRSSQKLIEERLELQQEPSRDTAFEVENCDLLACSHFHQGGYTQSLDISKRGIEAFDRNRHSAIASGYGENPGIACHSWAGLNQWFLGYPDQAVKSATMALTLAKDPGQYYHLTNAQMQLAILYQFLGDREATLEWATKTVVLSLEQGFVVRVAMGRLLEGWALAQSGDLDTSLDYLREGLDTLAKLGAGMDRPYFLGLMADALSLVGDFDEAVATIDEGLGLIDESRSHFYQAELFRLRGEILLKQAGTRTREAEADFQRALELARSQEARSIELRTAMNLARLWKQDDQLQKGRELLSGLYEGFDEGFDSPDLVDARTLLEELGEVLASSDTPV